MFNPACIILDAWECLKSCNSYFNFCSILNIANSKRLTSVRLASSEKVFPHNTVLDEKAVIEKINISPEILMRLLCFTFLILLF